VKLLKELGVGIITHRLRNG